MSAKPILESSGKGLLAQNLTNNSYVKPLRYAFVNQDTNWSELITSKPWLETESKLVVKPDQLIKRRGKLGLVGICNGLEEVKKWISDRINQEIKIGGAEGKLKNFIIEPFVAHQQNEEMYICIFSHRTADRILFYKQGGIDIGDVDKVAKYIDIPVQIDRAIVPSNMTKVDYNWDTLEIQSLFDGLPKTTTTVLKKFMQDLYEIYVKLYFTYLEINPLVVKDNGDIYIMDLAAKLDSAAEFLCRPLWGDIDFPPPFGRDAFPEEAYIADLDSKSGASLKLTILNPKGRIWTMVAGGGASVIYADTICELGGSSELANYGEYSGAPTEQQTYEYAKTVIGLMTRDEKIHPDGKVLIIGGGIANFTNVAATFRGIVTALQEAQPQLQKHRVQIFVRRGGPNYQEGLRRMRALGRGLGLPVHVFGPETHMTAVCGMALGNVPVPTQHVDEGATAKFLLPGGQTQDSGSPMRVDGEVDAKDGAENVTKVDSESKFRGMFFENTKAIVWGMQTRAVQSMLDFDFVCRRSEPSVVAMVYPFTGDHKQKFYWGHKEILIPVFRHMRDACSAHPSADVLVNFASLRSAYESTLQALRDHPQIRTIAIIAEGIPENLTRKLIKEARQKDVSIIGPATVGGIKPGCFKVGNTGGMMDNILHARLYRPGSVAYVSRSGGMSNELNNLIARATDGVYEGVAIGGDRYPGTTFIDHLIRYENDPNARLLILLGEVGGTEEYEVCEAIRTGRITKPLVAWCIGTCASHFSTEVQFGHAGSAAHSQSEKASEKNKALREAGAHVPDSFDQLHVVLEKVFKDMVANGCLVPREDISPPTVPMDYSWARELGLIRKPASFISSICDERGQELIYSGIPVSDVLHQDLGIGGVIGLLWFQRKLPKYICKYFEMCLMLTADHGPAVSGAHNTIVCARAGKDLVSSLVSGLLTIGERFGGALDAAARQFSEAFDRGLHPNEFVNEMRSKGQLIMGIGHRVKSINNPDQRVMIIKDYVMSHFPSTPLLDYALQVEKLTTAKKPNLILNVDGVIATSFVDMLRGCGSFTQDEAQEYIDIGAINSLFVLGRSIGFIGHYMDQKRLKQGLYRHPWDDISYILPEQYQ